MTLEDLIRALVGAGDDAIGTMVRAPNTRPPKMGNPTEPPPYTPPPYGALGQTAAPPQAPQLPIGVEARLQAVPFQRARWQPSDGALDMDGGSPTDAGGPVRGMGPLDAPEMPPLPSYIPLPDPELAALLSRDRDSVSRYRLENERELGALRSRADMAAENVARLERDRQRFEQNRWPRPAWRDGQPDRRFSPRSNRP